MSDSHPILTITKQNTKIVCDQTNRYRLEKLNFLGTIKFCSHTGTCVPHLFRVLKYTFVKMPVYFLINWRFRDILDKLMMTGAVAKARNVATKLQVYNIYHNSLFM